jgi:hypothetical protein
MSGEPSTRRFNIQFDTSTSLSTELFSSVIHLPSGAQSSTKEEV